jgi:hypothetical protein
VNYESKTKQERFHLKVVYKATVDIIHEGLIYKITGKRLETNPKNDSGVEKHRILFLFIFYINQLAPMG